MCDSVDSGELNEGEVTMARDPPLGTIIFSTYNRVGTDMPAYKNYVDSRWKIWLNSVTDGPSLEARPPIEVMKRLIYDQIVHERRIQFAFHRETGDKDVVEWCENFYAAVDEGLAFNYWKNMPDIYMEQFVKTIRLMNKAGTGAGWLRLWVALTNGYVFKGQILEELKCYIAEEQRISDAASAAYFGGVHRAMRSAKTPLNDGENAANSDG